MKKIIRGLGACMVLMAFARTTNAMGIFQSDVGYIPMPLINISLTLTDNLGVMTTVEHGSIDGKDYITGYDGLILNVIPLKNIASISFTKTTNTPAALMEKLDNNPLKAVIQLRNNKTLTIIVDGSLICFGKTPYGYVRIKLAMIDRIDSIKRIGTAKDHQ